MSVASRAQGVYQHWRLHVDAMVANDAAPNDRRLVLAPNPLDRKYTEDDLTAARAAASAMNVCVIHSDYDLLRWSEYTRVHGAAVAAYYKKLFFQVAPPQSILVDQLAGLEMPFMLALSECVWLQLRDPLGLTWAFEILMGALGNSIRNEYAHDDAVPILRVAGALPRELTEAQIRRREMVVARYYTRWRANVFSFVRRLPLFFWHFRRRYSGNNAVAEAEQDICLVCNRPVAVAPWWLETLVHVRRRFFQTLGTAQRDNAYRLIVVLSCRSEACRGMMLDEAMRGPSEAANPRVDRRLFHMGLDGANGPRGYLEPTTNPLPPRYGAFYPETMRPEPSQSPVVLEIPQRVRDEAESRRPVAATVYTADEDAETAATNDARYIADARTAVRADSVAWSNGSSASSHG
jgi:hypothetical protein